MSSMVVCSGATIIPVSEEGVSARELNPAPDVCELPVPLIALDGNTWAVRRVNFPIWLAGV